MAPIFFFDCDDCLYSKDLNILGLVRQKIREYFIKEIGVPENDAKEVQAHYYKTYGLSLRGLIKNYNIDPIDYDIKVDQALPLKDLIKRDEALINMLKGLHCKKWVFTNAYKIHALRCLELLGVENEFQGLTYTNYRVPDFNCKPEPEAFFRAMKDAGVEDPSECYFIDDSASNIDVAQQFGWTTVHLADDASASNHGDYQIENILDLPKILPHLWETQTNKTSSKKPLVVDAVAS